MRQFLETIRIVNGVPMLLKEHAARMGNTMLYHFKTDNSHLLETIEIPEQFRLGLVKCRVVYSDRIEKIEFSSYEKRIIRSLKIVTDDAIDYRFKSVDRTSLNQLMEQKGAADDVIIVKNGFVTDSSFSNLLFENEKGLFTPNTPLLYGIQRQNLLKSGLITEIRITRQDIEKFSKIHLINAMLLPYECVVEIEHIDY